MISTVISHLAPFSNLAAYPKWVSCCSDCGPKIASIAVQELCVEFVALGNFCRLITPSALPLYEGEKDKQEQIKKPTSSLRNALFT